MRKLSLTALGYSVNSSRPLVSGHFLNGKAQASSRADALLPWLMPLLLLALLTHCVPAKTPTEAHAVRSEHAAPVHATSWHEADSATD